MRDKFCDVMGLPKQQSVESFSAMFRIFFDAIDVDDEGDVTLAEMIRFAGMRVLCTKAYTLPKVSSTH